jgi:exosortase H (IPTLxxWG-CTERM-specific)
MTRWVVIVFPFLAISKYLTGLNLKFMGYSPEKKALKKKQPANSSIVEGVRSRWVQKWPVLFFVLGFAVLMVLFYAFLLSDYFQNNLQIPVVALDASISSFILNLFGVGTTATREVISSPSYSISVARGCDGLEAMALFAASLLAFPASWKYKLIGLVAGLAILFTLNIGRIVSLYITGLHYPKLFEFMHVEFWQAIFIIFAVGLWIFWIKWTRKEATHAAK